MPDIGGIGRLLIGAGIALVVIGFVLVAARDIPGLDRLGRLPGDISFERGNTRVYVPIVTCLLLSVILSVVLSLFFRR